jgi:Ferritin-like
VELARAMTSARAAARAAGVRRTLVDLLIFAAQIEHAVACQYLFAAHSMKCLPGEATPEQLELLRRWKGTLLSVARMEMEHLALVNNLLTAIGAPAVLTHPPFPTEAGSYPLNFRFSLESFSLDTLGRFTRIEVPTTATPEYQALRAFLGRPTAPGEDRELAQSFPETPPNNSISGLYDQIEDVLDAVPASDEAALFVGDATMQLGPASIGGSSARPSLADVELTVVRTAAEAKAVVVRIREEGEGGAPSRAAAGLAHFPRFVAMYMELRAEVGDAPPGTFRPGRDVGSNPVALGSGIAPPAATQVTDTVAVAAMFAYDLAYDTCLQLLSLLYATSSGDAANTAACRAAFLPMMSMVLRPLGDLLTQMDSGAGRLRAGPSFRAPNSFASPSSAAAVTVIDGQLLDLANRCGRLSNDAEGQGLDPRLTSRLRFLAESTTRIARNYTTPP